jgi:predicted ATP-dependent endonuclease of OLD family
MKLYSMKIKGFRRIQSTEILFGDATFLIGSNNSGKSTVFRAIEYLLSAQKTLPSIDYYSVIDDETGETKPSVTEIVFEAEFRDLPLESNNWRGFKGRIFKYEPEEPGDTGLSVTYKKTFQLGSDVVVEFRSLEKSINPKYEKCNTGQEYVDLGIDEEKVREQFSELSAKIGKSKVALEKLGQLDDIWILGTEETWFKNPGGIPGNVLKMLPRRILIPADTSENEIQGTSSGVLGKTLNELFEDVREASLNYQEAQRYLDALSKEIDPEDSSSEFGKMIKELNKILSSVFPDSQLHATTDLSDPNKSLKPTFNIEMSSNVRTPVSHQGSGMVRAAAFGILRFRQKWLSQKEDEHKRSLIVCFEEPEIYLHPSAANQMRDTIYDLSSSGSQIIATTHSPFIIDLSRKPKQVLNNMFINEDGISVNPFNVTSSYKLLEGDDKQHVKMLLRVDDHIARIFFTSNVVIIEGDTEEIVISESIKRLPKEYYLRLVSHFEIVKERGKASIIGLTKYLTAMGIRPIIVHDRDAGTPGAEVFNAPIVAALSGNGRVVQMHENIEDELGYSAPSNEKPLRAFLETTKWGQEWIDVPERWRLKMQEIFGEYIPS